MYKYIDCHSHPYGEFYKERGIDVDQVLEDLKKDDGATIAIGTDYENSKKAIEVALKHDNVWATIGIHPADNHAEIYDEQKFEELLRLGAGKVVGIGECGLDYYYFNADTDVEEQKARQKKVFISQIEFAIKNDLPLVIHGRPTKNSMDAYRDVLDILESYKAKGAGGARPFTGHAHFFVGNLEIAKRFLDLGFLMSFDGPITFTTEYDEVIKFLPIESIMIETDSPYAAPKRFRGQTNYPIYVKEVAQKIAELKNLTLDEVLEKTMTNSINLFRLSF